MKRVLISALHKSSGKTTLSIGLLAALNALGVAVQPFKKGPDYIDPMWLSRAAGRPCVNLDFHTQSQDEILQAFASRAVNADLSLVEGNKGLFDGVDVDGSDSNAAMAALLKAPVVLVVDTRGMTRGIAPVIQGYQNFQDDVTISGIILNHVGGPRHESKLRAALERYTDVPVIGALGRYPELEISERHLGLMPANEASHVEDIVANTGRVIAENVDLDIFRACAQKAPSLQAPLVSVQAIQGDRVRIGVARDSAFGFYYPDDLESLENAGAELVPFNTTRDLDLPDVDGLFIGGGFPETHAAVVSGNVALRDKIKAALENGMPAYAECGGLMYLARSLTWDGVTHEMVGIVPGDTVMHKTPVGRGYVKLEETGNSPWGLIGDGKTALPVHEFHYASLEGLPVGLSYAFKVRRGYGIDGENDGMIINNLIAGFSHHRAVGGNQWAERFVQFVRAKKNA